MDLSLRWLWKLPSRVEVVVVVQEGIFVVDFVWAVLVLFVTKRPKPIDMAFPLRAKGWLQNVKTTKMPFLERCDFANNERSQIASFVVKRRTKIWQNRHDSWWSRCCSLLNLVVQNLVPRGDATPFLRFRDRNVVLSWTLTHRNGFRRPKRNNGNDLSIPLFQNVSIKPLLQVFVFVSPF